MNAAGFSMQTLQFFLFLFLGFITLIRKAQQRTYFNKLDFPSTFLGLLPHEENGLSNLKDSVEEVCNSHVYNGLISAHNNNDFLFYCPG